jgi:hypothetical protein
LGNVCKILISFVNGANFEFPKTDFLGVVVDNVEKRGLANYFVNLVHVAKIPALMTFGLGSIADYVENMD